MGPNEKNGWEAWSKHVLLEQERLAEGQQRIENSIAKLAIGLATLKERSTKWGIAGGGVGGGIITGIIHLIYYLVKKLSGE